MTTINTMMMRRRTRTTAAPIIATSRSDGKALTINAAINKTTHHVIEVLPDNVHRHTSHTAVSQHVYQFD